MKRIVLFSLAALALIQGGARVPAQGGATAKSDAKAPVLAAATAMGGIEKLRALKSTRFEALGHWHLLEQSERPDGPWLVTYDEIKELRDYEHRRLRQTSRNRYFADPEGQTQTMFLADGAAAMEVDHQMRPLTMAQVQDAEEWLDFGPERVLLQALDAGDLKAEPDVLMQGVPHRAVSFTWRQAPVRLFLNAQTALPTAVELVRAHPYDIFWSVWGDFTSRLYYSLWMLEPGGIHYPRQWDIERNGQPYRTLTLTDIKFNVDLAAEPLDIPSAVKQLFAERGRTTIDDLPLGLPNRQPTEIVKDFIQIRGRWNVALIKQEDGVVVLEAPISSGYSAKVIAESEKRFPGLPIKAVISTSDAFPHLAGLREYASRGIPLYILDLNRPLVKRLLDAPFRSSPDALARKPRRADLRLVSRKVVIGNGENRLELYPVRSESGERMLMVYAPQHRLLYGSDLVQAQPDRTFFMPQYLSELAGAVAREKLEVDRVSAMHSDVLEWSEIDQAIRKAANPSPQPSTGSVKNE